ncbi:MAG TPA: hypothetical protein DET40_24740 [Lentisphaeria bacterium]|nr:MAG: hypothetical protein A2X45_01265 [Lentisphaerae bacterium GWF2_50_93]HCE46768.1 hypothetical protein [Lentisphaeria bacterium]
MTTGKSWVVYFLLAFKFMIEIAALTALLCLRRRIYDFLSGGLNRKVDVDSYLIPACGLLMLYFLGSFIYQIALLKSVSFQMNENGVIFRAGLLPWKKQEYSWTYSQLFRASYCHSFFGWLFNYGHITLTDSMGTTSFSTQFYIHNAKKLTEQINYHIMQ